MDNIDTELEKYAVGNQAYVEFHQKIINTKKTILGVKVPDLRRLAKKLASSFDYDDIARLLLQLDANIYEQVLLCGLVIANAKLSDEQRISLTKKYLNLADSWSEIDVFVQKKAEYKKPIWWKFAIDCLRSDKEFVVRYGIVAIMTNFLDKKYLDTALNEIRLVKHQGYYVKMAQAWFYATVAVYDFEVALNELSSGQIDGWVKRKALQKMLESYRISSEQKILIRELRQKVW